MAIPDSVLNRAVTLNVSRESWIRLGTYVDLLLRWQERINLISPNTIPDVWERHILDSLQALPHLPTGTTSFADLGSGGGTPALPLAIASGAHVHLYESNGKKAAFLREALRETGTTGTVHNIRLENIKTEPLPKVQAVTARALAPLPLLLDLAEPFLSAGACGVFHKGQDVDAELTQAQKSWRIQSDTQQSVTDSRAVILIVKEAKRV
jgi:16S rRNA (guanine527-N7)-methyltransferase